MCVQYTCTIVHSCLLFVVLVSTSCELLASPVSVLQNDTACISYISTSTTTYVAVYALGVFCSTVHLLASSSHLSILIQFAAHTQGIEHNSLILNVHVQQSETTNTICIVSVR